MCESSEQRKGFTVSPEGICKDRLHVLYYRRQSTSIYGAATVQLALRMVAPVFQVEISALGALSRCKANIAQARQIAMYLTHVVAGISFTEIGRLFGRDRTTVAHGCRLVEDWRENQRFDRVVAALEYALQLALSGFAPRAVRP